MKLYIPVLNAHIHLNRQLLANASYAASSSSTLKALALVAVIYTVVHAITLRVEEIVTLPQVNLQVPDTPQPATPPPKGAPQP